MTKICLFISILFVSTGQSDSVKWSSADASETAKKLLELGLVYHKFECVFDDNCDAGENTYAVRALNRLERYETALLMLVGFGGISLILALLYNAVRKHIFQESQSVDRTFDAGGKVSTSLTAVTVASQLLWPADLLQSATVTARVGIAGPFWYSVGAAINIALFPIMSAQLKTRAPGAKTYPQIIFARHGKVAHLVYCIFALLVNVVILANLLVAGKTAIQYVTKDATAEFCVIIIATLFGSYSFIGGLGTTFYVSYFNTMVLYISLIVLVLRIFYFPEDMSSEEKFHHIYDRVKNITGPVGNEERSMFTFLTIDGAIYAIVGFCLTSSITYCDQASWQSRIAAKPLQGVVGFFIATFMWFAIPSTIATTTGLVYLSHTTDNATYTPLTESDISIGLVTPYVCKAVLGNAGSFLVLTMMGMALMSTGSGEVMAVSSILVYDIYQTHLAPFRRNQKSDKCILCDKRKSPNGGEKENDVEVRPDIEEDRSLNNSYCTCPTILKCENCEEEEPSVQKKDIDYSVKRKYLCPHHGAYRVYQDQLLNYKNWCILWVTLALIPFGMLVESSGMDLNWAMFVGCILTIPGLPGVILTILWSKTTSLAAIIGCFTGLASGIATTLGVASTRDGGLSNFFENTSHPFALLAGSGSSLILGFLVNIIVSLVTHKIQTPEDEALEWKKLRDIDNPLSPWAELFREDFPEMGPREQPTREQFDKLFRKARIVSVIGGVIIIILFIIIVPSVMSSLHVLTFEEFETWTKGLHVWCFIMAVVVIFFAPIEEVMMIAKQMTINKNKRHKDIKDINIEDLREMRKNMGNVSELKEKHDTTESKDCTV